MARHRSDGAWDQRADAELIRAVRHWHETNPVPDLPEEYRGQASALAHLPMGSAERYRVRRELDEAAE